MKIKHSILLIAFLSALTTQVFSQDNFSEGTNLINFGVGFGNLYYGSFHGSGYNFSSTPALSLSVDHSFKKVEELQGTIGLGGLIGFKSSSAKYTYVNGNFSEDKWTDFIIAARATYHAGFLNTDKFDLYGGVMLGLRIDSYSFTSNFGAAEGNYGGGYFSYGIFVGGAYYFVNNLGAFAELGYDISYLKIGLSLKAGGHK